MAGGGECRYADNSVWCYGCAAALAVDQAKIITGTMSEAFSIVCFVSFQDFRPLLICFFCGGVDLRFMAKYVFGALAPYGTKSCP